MKRATYEDVLNAPEHKVAEILDGELFLSPMLAPRDGVVHFRLQGAWTILGVWEDAAVVRVEPFEAIELELGRLWADPPPQP